MKLRYYLRGIGIGIIVATAICLCAGSGKKATMTDAEVKARAKQLGMTEAGLLSELNEESIESEAMTVAEAQSVEPTEAVTETDIETLTTDETVTTTEEVTETEITTEAESESATESVEAKEDKEIESADSNDENKEEYILFEVAKGNGSDTVARNLAKAGLVSDAAAYDKYLCANGYDRRISAGKHEIPKGASEEEIAKIICGMK
ncbi:MAG: hypothetical protein KBT19_05700 [Lachnospiraceae bacterium]|nr:hypothetical protein [Candidatus Colinaster equi]